MDDPTEKTALEVAQEVRIRQLIQGAARRIMANRPEFSTESEATEWERERIREEVVNEDFLTEFSHAALTLMEIWFAQEQGYVPDDPNRGDRWHKPEGDDG